MYSNKTTTDTTVIHNSDSTFRVETLMYYMHVCSLIRV